MDENIRSSTASDCAVALDTTAIGKFRATSGNKRDRIGGDERDLTAHEVNEQHRVSAEGKERDLDEQHFRIAEGRVGRERKATRDVNKL